LSRSIMLAALFRTMVLVVSVMFFAPVGGGAG